MQNQATKIPEEDKTKAKQTKRLIIELISSARKDEQCLLIYFFTR